MLGQTPELLKSSAVRIGSLASAVVLAGGALAACDSSSGDGTPPDTTTSTSTTSTTSTVTAPPPTAGSSSTAGTGSGSDVGSGSGGDGSNGGSGDGNGGSGDGSGGGNSGSSNGGGTSLSDCAESQLRASIDPRPVNGSSTHGDLAVIVDFQNTSNRSCLIHGYPGAALVDSSGKQVKQATRTIRGKTLGLPPGENTLPTVTLKPGAFASAGLEGTNQQEVGAAQAGCDQHYPRILVTPPNTRTPVPFTVKWPECYSFDVHPTNVEKNPPS